MGSPLQDFAPNPQVTWHSHHIREAVVFIAEATMVEGGRLPFHLMVPSVDWGEISFLLLNQDIPIDLKLKYAPTTFCF